MMHEALELTALLRGIARRLATVATWQRLARGAAWTAGALVAWALATMVLPVPLPLGRVSLVLAALLLGAYPVILRLSWPTALDTARITDRRAGLQDRLSTAVELLAQSARPPGLARLQVADAVAAAQDLDPRRVAPLRAPREAGLVLAGGLALLLWSLFLSGWSLPATPAARALAVVHREGRSITEAGRRLEALGTSQALPEARRFGPQMRALGERLQGPRMDRERALGLVQDFNRQLGATQDLLHRQLEASLPEVQAPGGGRRAPAASPSASGGDRLQRLNAAVREVRGLTGQLERGGQPVEPRMLSREMRALANSLEEMNAPVSTRQRVAQARREASQGHLSAAAGSMNEALQDLEGLERMAGDAQALGDARQSMQQAATRIAKSGPLGAGSDARASETPSESTSSPQASGPNPPSIDESGTAPPPPGPNQGSLPGQGTGPQLGAAAPRLQGTHVPEHLGGTPGQGPSTMRLIVAPGQTGTSHVAARRLPASVAHELDQSVSEAPLPPAYVSLVRQYFQTQGGAP